MNRYLNAILALEPDSARHHWLRAVVRYRLEENAGAMQDVAWLMEHKPAGLDLQRVEELQHALEARHD